MSRYFTAFHLPPYALSRPASRPSRISVDFSFLLRYNFSCSSKYGKEPTKTKKEEFDQLFIKAKTKFLPQSEEEINQRLMEYVKDPTHAKIEEIMVYLQMESVKYTNDLVYSLLLATVVEED